MLNNKSTQIIGNKVILVPYKKEHVPKYHEWMKSEELQQLTGSEPLTLEEEYAMQESWMRDINKCTFIILDKETYTETKDEINSMIGDTNLFFINADSSMVAEAEIMIAEPWARSRHCGFEAMLLMFLYGINELEVKEYIAKIKEGNLYSIKMFVKMGFSEISRSTVFNEVTYNKIVTDQWVLWLKQNTEPFQIQGIEESAI